MAAPTFQAAGTAVSATTGTLTVAWPAHAVGDIALLIVESNDTTSARPSLTTANGFALLWQGSANNQSTLSVYWCRATTTSMASPVLAALNNHQYGQIITFRNCVATGNPWDSFAGISNVAYSVGTPIDSGALAASSVADVLYVDIIARSKTGAGAGFSSWSNTDLSTLTEIVDAGTVSGDGGGLGVNTGLVGPAKAFTTWTQVSYTATGGYTASALAVTLLPAGGAPPPDYTKFFNLF